MPRNTLGKGNALSLMNGSVILNEVKDLGDHGPRLRTGCGPKPDP